MLNVGIFPAFSNVFLQLSKAKLFLHFKNVEMFPTFRKCRNISYIFPMCFCSCQKLNCSYIFKMQKCFLHFGCRNISSIFKCVSQKLELFLHFKNAAMFPTFLMQEYFQHFQASFCGCQKLNCSCILKMQKCFLHF